MCAVKAHLDEDVESPGAGEEVRALEVQLELAHEVRDHDRRAPADADPTVHEDLAAGIAGVLDKVEALVERAPDAGDAVVGDVVNVEHGDRAESFFEPERVGGQGGRAGEGTGEREGRLARWGERRLAHRDDVGDAELLEHERVRGVVQVPEVLRAGISVLASRP